VRLDEDHVVIRRPIVEVFDFTANPANDPPRWPA
jgi:hypothetical protein